MILSTLISWIHLVSLCIAVGMTRCRGGYMTPPNVMAGVFWAVSLVIFIVDFLHRYRHAHTIICIEQQQQPFNGLFSRTTWVMGLLQLRYEHDSTTIRLQHATRFFVRSHTRSYTRISGRRVLHVD